MNAPAVSNGAGVPSLDEGKKLLSRSRLFGRVSAIIFFLAALAILDSLQSLVRHEFNSVDLVSGESMLLSGMLPADAKSHEDLHFTIESADAEAVPGNAAHDPETPDNEASGNETTGNEAPGNEAPGLGFSPLETYKGFWMGGQMWRAELAAPQGLAAGTYHLVIEDIIKENPDPKNYDERDRAILYGGRQNPALAFTVTVWPSESARRAADSSFVRRLTGLPAFGVAAALVVGALLAGLANWIFFGQAEKALAVNGIFFIHGMKELRPDPKLGPAAPVGYKAAFSHAGERFVRGDDVLLYDRDFQEKGEGFILEVDAAKAHALFPLGGTRPQYSWLVGRKK